MADNAEDQNQGTATVTSPVSAAATGADNGGVTDAELTAAANTVVGKLNVQSVQPSDESVAAVQTHNDAKKAYQAQVQALNEARRNAAPNFVPDSENRIRKGQLRQLAAAKLQADMEAADAATAAPAPTVTTGKRGGK